MITEVQETKEKIIFSSSNLNIICINLQNEKISPNHTSDNGLYLQYIKDYCNTKRQMTHKLGKGSEQIDLKEDVQIANPV